MKILWLQIVMSPPLTDEFFFFLASVRVSAKCTRVSRWISYSCMSTLVAIIIFMSDFEARIFSTEPHIDNIEFFELDS
jgi:hypothetical protein